MQNKQPVKVVYSVSVCTKLNIFKMYGASIKKVSVTSFMDLNHSRFRQEKAIVFYLFEEKSFFLNVAWLIFNQIFSLRLLLKIDWRNKT